MQNTSLSSPFTTMTSEDSSSEVAGQTLSSLDTQAATGYLTMASIDGDSGEVASAQPQVPTSTQEIPSENFAKKDITTESDVSQTATHNSKIILDCV